MKIYVSLPMFGHTNEDNRQRAAAAKRLIELALTEEDAFAEYMKDRGWSPMGRVTVVTPTEVAANETQKAGRALTDTELLLADLKEVAESNLVVALDGWRDSRGCLAEVAFAQTLGRQVVHLSMSMARCMWVEGIVSGCSNDACRASEDAANGFRWAVSQYIDAGRLKNGGMARIEAADLPY